MGLPSLSPLPFAHFPGAAATDWLPSLVNAGRAFVTIGAVALFWIVTEWPNGAPAITFAAIAVLLFAPRADQAYAVALEFAGGIVLGTIFSAIIEFAVLPGLETFEAFSIVLGLYLIPGGALMAQPRHRTMFTYMTAYFCSYIQPANEMSYDTLAFYNSALAIVSGSAHAAIGSVVRTAQASYLMYAKRWSFCGVPSSAPPAFPGCH